METGTQQFVEQGVYIPPPQRITVEERSHRLMVVGRSEADAIGNLLIEIGASGYETGKMLLTPVNEALVTTLKASPDYELLAGARWTGKDDARIWVIEVETFRQQEFRYPQPEDTTDGAAGGTNGSSPDAG